MEEDGRIAAGARFRVQQQPERGFVDGQQFPAAAQPPERPPAPSGVIGANFIGRFGGGQQRVHGLPSAAHGGLFRLVQRCHVVRK